MQRLFFYPSPLSLAVFFVCCFTSIASWAQIIIQDSAWKPGEEKSIEIWKDATHFFIIGDWGRNGADHQIQVAEQMGALAGKFYPRHIISTGDNFYPQGVISPQDPLFYYSFENIYKDFSLQVDWYLILGNHDYMANPDAQVQYSAISRRWKMPARYFSKHFGIPGTQQKILIAFIDTNPLIPEFYKNELYGPNVKTQDTVHQKKWLEGVLAANTPDIAWKFLVGHHPMYSAGGRTENYDTRAIRFSLKPLLDKHSVDAYINGHEHNLQYLKPTGVTHHFISGSGSEKTPVKAIPEAKMAASEYGFMIFSVRQNTCLVQVIDYTGQLIYHTILRK